MKNKDYEILLGYKITDKELKLISSAFINKEINTSVENFIALYHKKIKIEKIIKLFKELNTIDELNNENELKRFFADIEKSDFVDTDLENLLEGYILIKKNKFTAQEQEIVQKFIEIESIKLPDLIPIVNKKTKISEFIKSAVELLKYIDEEELLSFTDFMRNNYFTENPFIYKKAIIGIFKKEKQITNKNIFILSYSSADLNLLNRLSANLSKAENNYPKNSKNFKFDKLLHYKNNAHNIENITDAYIFSIKKGIKISIKKISEMDSNEIPDIKNILKASINAERLELKPIKANLSSEQEILLKVGLHIKIDLKKIIDGNNDIDKESFILFVKSSINKIAYKYENYNDFRKNIEQVIASIMLDVGHLSNSNKNRVFYLENISFFKIITGKGPSKERLKQIEDDKKIEELKEKLNKKEAELDKKEAELDKKELEFIEKEKEFNEKKHDWKIELELERKIIKRRMDLELNDLELKIAKKKKELEKYR